MLSKDARKMGFVIYGLTLDVCGLYKPKAFITKLFRSTCINMYVLTHEGHKSTIIDIVVF